MATINRDFFITQFKEEVDDHVQRMTRLLFQLEEQSGDSLQLIEEIFRIAHTLKGSARMMGYEDISALAHKMEDLLVEIRDGHVEQNSTMTDLLFYCLDTINYLVEGLSKHIKRTTNLDEFSRLFQEVLSGKEVEIPHLQSQIIRSEPSKELPESSDLRQAETTSLTEAEERQYVHIHTTDLDVILNLVGEIIINQYRYEGQRTVYQEFLQNLREHSRMLTDLQKLVNQENGKLPACLSSLTKNLERSAAEMLQQSKFMLKRFRSDGQQMRMAVNKLQERVIDVRMVPASRIFHLFPRLVRMTARLLGKSVDLTLLGEDTKIDSRIIEEMRDPLMHLVQNAIHHGIESSAARQSYGKPAAGMITIAAHQEGNRIVLSVRDDGQGIYSEQIKNMAIKNGLISRRDLKNISEQEILEVLFHPGFSTSEVVDDIAGRGFGLNIVRTHVDRVQGEIEIRTQPGKGTEFIIKLPLTLTIMNALLVQVLDDVFAIPTIAIEKTFDIWPKQIEFLGKIPVIALEDTLIPVIELHQLLLRADPAKTGEYPPCNVLDDRSRKTVIIVRAEERRIGFLVDDLVEEREIVIKHLGPCLKRVRNVAGATTVRGDVVIILSVRDLVRSADAFLEGKSGIMLPPKHVDIRQDSASTDHVIPRILLIDDSYNTREIERLILESAGYEVVVAEHGRQGLDYLKKAAFDLVITGIEMPHINGITLTKTINQDDKLREIPVIIVSTKGSEADQQGGVQAGAAAYIVKGEFDEHRLLEIVDSCLA